MTSKKYKQSKKGIKVKKNVHSFCRNFRANDFKTALSLYTYLNFHAKVF